MTNKIDSYTSPQVAGPSRVRTGEAGGQRGAGQAQGRPESNDSVRLTDDAVLVQQAERAAAQASDVDEQRVAQVRQAIADGSYQVDPKAIAARLARMEWELSR